LIDQYGQITLSASEMSAVVFSEPGDHTFTGRFKPARANEVITFTLDKAFPPDASDPRERGIIVASIDCE
jgi:hypothetical protein